LRMQSMSCSLALYLEDIIEAIRKIRSYPNLLNFEEFCVDERTVDAVIRNLIIIGEAVKNIPEDTRKMEPGIEWRKIAGLRDFAAHAYFKVSNQIVWDVLQTKLLPLDEAATRILNEI
jgi:uncharacterized protein with HEPN domain